MKKGQFKIKALAAFMASSMVFTGTAGNLIVYAAGSGAGEASYKADNVLINSFTDGKSTSGLMARMWFPDAGAGYDGDGDGKGDYIDQVEGMITDIYEAGFGGVEITMLADNADYYWQGGNELAGKIGWGSSAWAEILSAALDTANSKEKEFLVDVTITAHWPMIINSVDPNDDNQQQQAAIADAKQLTREMMEQDIELNLPEMKTADSSNTERAISSFIFKDTLISAVLAKTDSDGNLDLHSLTDISDCVTARDGYAAGVPESSDENGNSYVFMKRNGSEDGEYSWTYYTNEQAGTEYGMNLTPEYTAVEEATGKVLKDAVVTVTYSTFGSRVTIKDANGNDIPGAVSIPEFTKVKTTTDENGDLFYSTDLSGVDGAEELIPIYRTEYFGDRAVMADTQQIYSLDHERLESLLTEKGIDLADGDYQLIAAYRRGTGQIASGGENITMPEKTYAIDYFDADGAKVVTDYWDNNLLPHEYTCADGQVRTLRDLMQENGGTIFEDSIELSRDSIFWSKNLAENFKNENGYDIGLYAAALAGMPTNDSEGLERIREDYDQILSSQYTKYHSGTISNWCKSFGYAYRAQGHGLDAVDAGASSLAADIPESDNGSDGDGTRTIAAGVNVDPNKHYLSMEALTFGTGFGEFPSWYYCLNTINRYYSEGINRIILHGTPFTKSYTDYDKAWPGWDFMSFMAWNARQVWWSDVDIFTDYIGRVQGVLQDGTTKVPVAIMQDGANSGLGNTGLLELQSLVGRGYSFNVVTQGLIESDYCETAQSSLSNRTVLSEKAEYQVLVLNNIHSLTTEAMEKLVGYARAGLAILDLNSDITEAYGTSGNGEDEQIQNLYTELQQQESYTKVSSEGDMIQWIAANVDSGAAYDAKWLETTRLYDAEDGSNYYMFYNESDISVSSEKPGTGPTAEEAGNISTQVTLKGNGVPYKLDPADGSITRITGYTQTDDGVSMNLDIEEGDLYFILLSDNGYIAQQAVTESTKTQQAAIELGQNQEWTLDLESWGPDHSPENTDANGDLVNPTLSEKSTLEGIKTTLVPWTELSLTAEELSSLGVDSTSSISGLGYYTVEADVPDYGRTNKTGAVLSYDFNELYNCMTGITVTNSEGETFKIHGNNPNHKYVDLGAVLTPGKNTITIKISGDLANRAGSGGGMMGPGGVSENGLLNAGLQLYTVADISSETETMLLTSLYEAFLEVAKKEGYTAESLEALSTALEYAKSVLEEEQPLAEEVGKATAELIAAGTSLEKEQAAEVDKDTLQAIYDSLSQITNEQYTQESFLAFEEALAEAKSVLDDQNAVSEETDQAIAGILSAVIGLRQETQDAAAVSAKEFLTSAIAVYENKENAQGYTSESMERFVSALTNARTVVSKSKVTAKELSTAFAKLVAAGSGLEKEAAVTVDKVGLQASYDALKNTKNNGYTQASWKAFEEMLVQAQTVLSNEAAAESDVQAANSKLLTAFAALERETKKEVKEVDKSTLQILYTSLASITNQNYTDASWLALKNALTNAKTILDRADAAETQVKSAVQTLIAATAGLKTKPAVQPDSGSVKKGDSFTAGSLKYKITSLTSKTVSVTGAVKKSTTKLTVPSKVKYKNVTYKVTAVADKAFYKYTKLKQITIGSNVTKIGKYAFYGDKNLKSIQIKGKNLKSAGKKSFTGIHKKAVVKVPKNKVSAYKKVLKNKGLKDTASIK